MNYKSRLVQFCIALLIFSFFLIYIPKYTKVDETETEEIYPDISSPSGDGILITEVYYDPIGSDPDEEWFEMFNPTFSDVDLTGWTVEDNSVSFALSGIIPAQDYLVVARDLDAFNNMYGMYPDLWGSTLNLDNNGDHITLFNNESIEVDYVSFEEIVTGWDIEADAGETLVRESVIDTDTEIDWVASTYHSPGFGPYISDSTPPSVNITSPLDGANISGSVFINVNATDWYGIEAYYIYIDGILRSTSSSYLWYTRDVHNGSHEISARCRDTNDNIGEHNITVNVENSPSTGLIKIMTYNIEQGNDPNWKEVVKEENPDIVVFVETGDWDDNSNLLLNQHLEEFNNYFIEESPYRGNTAQNIFQSEGGEAIMSRFPILESVKIPLVTLDDNSNYDVIYDFMFWRVNVSGLELNLIGAHLKPFIGATNEARRELAQEGIINFMDNLGEVPILYMGDLNSYSPDDIGILAPEGNLGYGPMTMLMKPNDPIYGQYSSQIHNFTDVYRLLNPTEPGYTYGHQDPEHESRIDFIIANDFLSNYIVNSSVGDTDSANIGSYHYCVDFFFDVDACQILRDITPPAKVVGLNSITISDSQIHFYWNANSESDFDYYMIYRDGINIANTTNTYYNDIELTPGTFFDYKVAAVDTSGNVGVPSDTLSVRTLDVVPELPSIVGILLLLSCGSVIIAVFIYRRKHLLKKS